MSGWEEQANRNLRALAEAYQRGQIDLAEFRARRRRVLQGVRERFLQTQPHAAGTAHAGHLAAPPSSRRKWALLLTFCGILVTGLLIFVFVLGAG
ncbi:hypothetical protein KQ945_00825 [Bacillus subtilis subsp. subtilis]|nr:hypothetical protein [Bacillus subtilis subsp. subtilis]